MHAAVAIVFPVVESHGAQPQLAAVTTDLGNNVSALDEADGFHVVTTKTMLELAAQPGGRRPSGTGSLVDLVRTPAQTRYVNSCPTMRP